MADTTKPKGSGAKRSRATATKRTSGTARKPSRAKTASARSSAGASRTSGTTKRSTSAKSKSASKSSNGRAKSAPKSASSNGRAKSTTKATSTGAGAKSPARSNSKGTSNGRGFTDSVKQVADKAKGPAIAVGAAAAGIAGGLALKSRSRRRTVLGVPLPKHLPSIDPKSVAKTVGEASTQLAKTSKSVSKDIERAGDQAEKIGKILK